MVFDDLVLRCDNAVHFPSNDKACKAADDINRHVLYRAGSVLKAFEIISGFIEKDLVVGFFKSQQLNSSPQLSNGSTEVGKHIEQHPRPIRYFLLRIIETKLLLYTRIPVTKAMEIDSALRERAEQTLPIRPRTDVKRKI